MFENLLYQDQAKQRLLQDINSGKFPPSILFSGPVYSGKMTAALELSRVIHCMEKGEWNCPCQNCCDHRTLENPETLILGSRYFSEEIKASRSTFLKKISPAGKIMYIRAVRKFLGRFNQNIWNTDDQKYKKQEASLSRIQDNLDIVRADNFDLGLKKNLKIMDQIESEVDKILQGGILNQITIDQIRNIISWSHRASINKKIVIIENAEKMNDSSRNSLLKILEEPPGDLHFILISSNDGGIIPTIKSRVRKYYFKSRSQDQERQILSRIFRDEDAVDISSFFLQQSGISYDELRAGADGFINAVLSGGPAQSFFSLEFVPDDRVGFRVFLKMIMDRLHAHFGEWGDVDFGMRASRYIREAYYQVDAYNQNPGLILESLYYKLRKSHA